MELLAEVIVILIAALMPIVLAAILLFYPREEEGSEDSVLVPGFYTEDTMPVASIATAWHPDPLWYLELTNAGTGLRIGKRFQKELILGRFVGTGEQSNMLYPQAREDPGDGEWRFGGEPVGCQCRQAQRQSPRHA